MAPASPRGGSTDLHDQLSVCFAVVFKVGGYRGVVPTCKRISTPADAAPFPPWNVATGATAGHP